MNYLVSNLLASIVVNPPSRNEFRAEMQFYLSTSRRVVDDLKVETCISGRARGTRTELLKYNFIGSLAGTWLI